MDVLDFLANLGIAAKEIKEPMTLEEALDIVDPSKMVESPQDPAIAMAREIKAKTMIVEYVKKKMAEETENG